MRQTCSALIDPFAKFLLRIGISADSVTLIGALLACVISVAFISKGDFLLGGILLSLVGVSDLLDGTMARISNSAGSWGAFLDSTLDRIVDGFVFGAIIFWVANLPQKNSALLWCAIVAAITAQTTSYTRARWESLGVMGKVGLVERSERMIALCGAFILTGLGLDIIEFVIYGLAVTSSFTVVQRVIFVRRQLKL